MAENSQDICKLTVLLDLDDTILDFHAAERVAVSETLLRLGIEPSEKIVSRYSEINKSRWELLELGQLTREQVMVSRFDMLFDELGVKKSGTEAREMYENRLKICHYFVPGAQELLENLYRDYELYIVSNGTADVQESRLVSAGIKKYFKKIFISEEIGFEKPNKEFFDACFAQIPGLEPQRTVIVGDSLTSDIRGGINAGVKTCWFNPGHKSPRADIVPDYQISSLDELPLLLLNIIRTFANGNQK